VFLLIYFTFGGDGGWVGFLVVGLSGCVDEYSALVPDGGVRLRVIVRHAPMHSSCVPDAPRTVFVCGVGCLTYSCLCSADAVRCAVPWSMGRYSRCCSMVEGSPCTRCSRCFFFGFENLLGCFPLNSWRSPRVRLDFDLDWRSFWGVGRGEGVRVREEERSVFYWGFGPRLPIWCTLQGGCALRLL
jgi:hypothetical protein